MDKGKKMICKVQKRSKEEQYEKERNRRSRVDQGKKIVSIKEMKRD